jgi:hypothetical protein
MRPGLRIAIPERYTAFSPCREHPWLTITALEPQGRGRARCPQNGRNAPPEGSQTPQDEVVRLPAHGVEHPRVGGEARWTPGSVARAVEHCPNYQVARASARLVRRSARVVRPREPPE